MYFSESVNYSDQPLYTDFPDGPIQQVNFNQLKWFLPKSCLFDFYQSRKHSKNPHPAFRSLESFAGITQSNSSLLFTGCRTIQVEWVPGLLDEEILAVLCCPSHFELAKVVSKQLPYLVQFWKISKEFSKSPEFMFGFVIPEGPAMKMKFCPSGGLSEKRLALMAVTAFGGKVNLFEIPKESSKLEGKWLMLPKALELDSRKEDLITIIDWSTSKGHSQIIAANAAGWIFLWQIDSKSPLLSNNGKLFPSMSFQPLQGQISVLSFNPLDSQFLLIAGYRLFQVVKLSSSFPEIILQDQKITGILCATWMASGSMIVLGVSEHVSGTIELHLPFKGITDVRYVSNMQNPRAVTFSKWTGKTAWITWSGGVFVAEHIRSDKKRVAHTHVCSTATSKTEPNGEKSLIIQDVFPPQECTPKNLENAKDLFDQTASTTDVAFSPNFEAKHLYAVAYHLGFVAVRSL